MPYNDDYSVLLHLFVRLVEAQAGTKVEEGEAWLNDAQTLSLKLFRHLVSMQKMAEGVTVLGEDLPSIHFVDHASIKVVARAALETYLVFYYLYGNSDRTLSEVRHKTWRLGGLTDRQSFHASTDEHQDQINRERLTVEALKAEIEVSPKLKNYTSKQRAKLLSGEWRIGHGWADLSAHAGFHEKYFKNVYGYLCGYSHSSYLSALQVGEASQSMEDQKQLSNAILGVGVFIMAHFSFTYSQLFTTAKQAFSTSPSAKAVAEKWRFGPEDMAVIYDR